MRHREPVISVPLHPEGLNNNQLQRSNENEATTREVGNLNESPTTTPKDYASVEETEEFRVAEDTTTWSSLAIARDNIQLASASSGQNINNNLTTPRLRRNSSIESLIDYDRRNSSREDSSHESTPSDWSDLSEEGNIPFGCCGIVNPNYPGFQHLAPSLHSDTDLTEDEDDARPQTYQILNNQFIVDDNEYNNNVDERDDRKLFYDRPKFNLQPVATLTKSVVPPTEKCINYVKSVEVSRSEEKNLTEEAEIIENSIIEAETHLTVLEEPEEALSNSVTEARAEFSEATLSDKLEREVAVEVEVVELSTSVKESLQFPEIEEILDSGKTSEVGETEDTTVVEHIDLIREAKELPCTERSKIGNRETTVASNADDSESNSESEGYAEEQPTYTKLEEIDLLSSIGRDIGVDLEKYVQSVPDVVAMEAVDTVRAVSSRSLPVAMMKDPLREDTNKLIDRDYCDASSADSKKKEKMARNQAKRRQEQQQQQRQSRSSNSRRSDKRRSGDVDSAPGGFDVYNIETAMPKIDLDAIESHLRAAREEERRGDDDTFKTAAKISEVEPFVIPKEEKDPEREDLVTRFDRLVQNCQETTTQRRNDREEIRRRLAMGPDAEDLRAERGKKPSLQSRLQSGMNLQICFMNETPSDTESPCSENDASPGSTPMSLGSRQNSKQQGPAPMRPQVLSLPPLRLDSGSNSAPVDEADFFARQARLQTEARMALAQAKEMAHMQMEVERQRLKQSPITEMVRSSLEKVGVQLGEDRRRLSRVLLTELNVAQLQVVANDLHARIAALNEALVEGLLRRDDLHMEQDSMLVDVEDLTRYLGAKQESMKKKQQQQQQKEQTVPVNRSNQQSTAKSLLKPKLSHRSLVALVRK